MIQNSDRKTPSIIWESTDDLYPSLKAFCTYEPPRFTITVRHTSGAEKSACQFLAILKLAVI